MVAKGHAPVDIELLVSKNGRFMEELVSLEFSFWDELDYYRECLTYTSVEEKYKIQKEER